MKSKQVTATLKNIEPKGFGDWQDAVTIKTFRKLLSLQANTTPVVVIGVACEVDGTFENDYHDIQLPCGITVEAVAGCNLERV